MSTILLALIRGYQYLFRPLLGANCRFAPCAPSTHARRSRSTARLKGTRAGRSQGVALPPVSFRRLRPRSLNHNLRSSGAPRRALRDPSGCHGYTTSDPVRDLLVLRVLLWEAWQKEFRPPPPPPAVAAQQGKSAPPADLPAAPATSAAAPGAPGAAAPGAVPTAPPAANGAAAASGQLVTITTDLYRAQIDTTGGTITEVALLKHRDPHDETKPYVAAAQDSRAHERRAIGVARRGHAQPSQRLRSAAGPARARPRRRSHRASPADDRGERQQGRADAHVPSRQLRDRRRVRHHEQRRRADRAVRLFPADARHQDARHATTRWRRSRTPGRSSTTRPTSSRRSSSASSTSSPPTRRESFRTRRTRTTAGSEWSSTTS